MVTRTKKINRKLIKISGEIKGTISAQLKRIMQETAEEGCFPTRNLSLVYALS